MKGYEIKCKKILRALMIFKDTIIYICKNVFLDNSRTVTVKY